MSIGRHRRNVHACGALQPAADISSDSPRLCRPRLQQRRALTTRALFGKGGGDKDVSWGAPGGAGGVSGTVSFPLPHATRDLTSWAHFLCCICTVCVAQTLRVPHASTTFLVLQGGGGMFGGMGNLMENLKKAQALVQVEAAKVQEELAK